ncbi:TonB-dependent receptor domain-containing protein [Sphingomonas sp. Leaf28]|uniref:TonB-dependent receptor domain-containing protein n=1 Tax=Sphingomonas sp. Leaf28 TaxID=1735695 RepID=UPI0009E7A83E|nr:TonB-dependent receptor [Sphingomonas sp. Leaf28]
MSEPKHSPPPGVLSRTFHDLQDERIADLDMLTALARAGMVGGLGWDDLLRSDRILMISEAGAGKTYECRDRQKALWTAGEPAFFLELVELARSPVREMLTIEEEVRFDAWLAAEHEVATFLLDSIDELKLTQGSFEQALKRLAKALVGRLDRARIVITTRPVPFDQELVRRHLPVPDRWPAGGLAESFVDVAMRNSPKGAEAESKQWISVALMPLSDDQIRTMAVIEKIEDPDVMIADLRTRDAMDFARRPQDLVELCADWRDHHRIRTHREQVGNNVDVKLRPRRDRDRPELVEISPERARAGAGRLALAMLLTRRLTIRHAAEADRGGTPGTALDPGVILTDWTQSELRTLLERPLFGFASYGRVRFHHRSVLEFLAAERLGFLIDTGVPLRAVTWNAYFQFNVEGTRWRGDFGLRYVNSSVDSLGYGASVRSYQVIGVGTANVVFNPIQPIVGGGDYSRLLPSANFAYDLADGLRLRLAASQAISRPTFGQLSSAKDYSAAQSNTPVVTNAGSPDLKPVSADQADVSLEYYPSNRLALTVAAFYKHLTNFVTTQAVPFTLVPTNQVAGAPASFPFTELTYVNGDSATVYGIEVGGQYFLDNGLGVQANATYNRSRAEREGRPTVNLEDAVPFSANAKLFYEKHGINASVSYQYQSKFVSSQYSYIDSLAIKQTPYHELAASVSYDILPQVTIYAQGSNLLDSATKRFSTYSNVPAFYEYTGRAFFFGFRARV